MPFIVIEALDAGGSQTQTNVLVKHLKREKYKPLQLHFPQEDRATGRFIYEKFLNSHNKPKLSDREKALMYIQDFYSRKEDIEKALRKGKKYLVVSDRFYTSTMAYQTVGLSGVKRRKMLQWLQYLAQGLPKHDLVIFLDTPPRVSLRHLKTQPKNYHERLPKLVAFRRSYLMLAKEQKWVVINSMEKPFDFAQGKQRSIQNIHEEVWKHVQKIL